jgi:sugar lactone lactonase YvrE
MSADEDPGFRIVGTGRDLLGEGAHWDAERGELVHVDILGGVVHGWLPRAGRSWSFGVGGEVGAVVPRRDGGYVLAVEHDLIAQAADGTRQVLASAEEQEDHTRFNDCRSDPSGTLWAGTMSRDRRPGTAGLYRLRPGEALERVLGGTTISNGIGWSPDSSLMYFIDSTSYQVDAFDYDLATAEIANRRPFAVVNSDDGLPDGLAVDAEGYVWVCLFGGGAIRRYAPDGSLDTHVPLPVTCPTCPAFGDADLGTLYITSTRHRLTREQLEAEPIAGALLAWRPGVRGQVGNAFGG